MKGKRLYFSILASALVLAGCTAPTPDAAAPSVTGDVAAPPTGGADPITVTLVTTNSFEISEEAVAAFEAESGMVLNIVPIGSAGILANQLVLTRDAPLGDAFFGVDNTFASRLLDGHVVAPFTPANLSQNAAANTIEGLIPITQGDVCVNVDLDWFAAHPGVAVPATFTDLLDPSLAGQTILLNPTTSSPGMAFLLATVATFGDHELGSANDQTRQPYGLPGSWQEYWELLLANDPLIVDSWSQAFFTDYSGGGGGGSRPIVISYASSPAATLNDDGSATTTKALLDTCFLQVEYAGVLAGAANPAGAQQLVEFLSGPTFQAELPSQMYVYPIDTTVELPAEWAQFTIRPAEPLMLGTSVIEQNRERFLEQWLQLTQQ